jgi:peroxidase
VKARNFNKFYSFLLRERIEEVDLNITSELTHKFLKGAPGETGFNLPAIIIHMGRDHGTPSYGAWRERCGLTKPANFDDLAKYIRDPDVLIPRLQKFYQSVDDLDLFLMGLAEVPAHGALVGPTFACILGLQFQRIRRSDRFWYENFFFPSSFTEGKKFY